jgi:hypothetical protein
LHHVPASFEHNFWSIGFSGLARRNAARQWSGQWSDFDQEPGIVDAHAQLGFAQELALPRVPGPFTQPLLVSRLLASQQGTVCQKQAGKRMHEQGLPDLA